MNQITSTHLTLIIPNVCTPPPSVQYFTVGGESSLSISVALGVTIVPICCNKGSKSLLIMDQMGSCHFSVTFGLRVVKAFIQWNAMIHSVVIHIEPNQTLSVLNELSY